VLTIVVRGTPVPEGSKSAFALRKAGAFKGGARVVDDNRPALATWRGDIRQEAQRFVDADPARYPLDGPVLLAVTFTKARTGGLTKRLKWLHWPYKKPDLDKYLRAVLDALQSAGVVRDDGQVVEILRLAKHFARDDLPAPVLDEDAKYMLSLPGTYLDVLHTPGVVIRVAHVTEFPGVRADLAELGRSPEEVTGGW
jgi:Holliday junction resolvase RusA-like endonuclease